MNTHCQNCPADSVCKRHNIRKTKRQVELCKCVANTKDKGIKYWNAWEKGELGSKPTTPPIILSKNSLSPSRRPRPTLTSKSITDLILPEHIKCEHIGAFVREDKCTTCGKRGKPLPIYKCNYNKNKTGECSIPNRNRKIYNCQSCHIGRELFNDAFDAVADKLAQDAINNRRRPTFRISSALLEHYVPPIKSTIVKPCRHLIYHLWPLPGYMLDWHIEQLAIRRSLFNGKFVIGIAHDDHTAKDIESKLRSKIDNIEIISVTNNANKREGTTFLKLLKRIPNDDNDNLVFYAQGKGVRDNAYDIPTIQRWCDIMYKSCLDYYPLVENILRLHPLAGSFRCNEAFHHTKSFGWHYSGTYLWFRMDDILTRNYTHLINKWWCVESWPGQLVKQEHSGLIFQDDVPSGGGMYDQTYSKHALSNWEKWKEEHANQKT